MDEADTSAKLAQYSAEIGEAYSISIEQRQSANADIRFCNVDGGMWEDWLSDDYTANRAKLEFDITTDFVQRYVGEWTLNRANVTFTPDDTATSDEEAETLTGIYRADFKDNDGQMSQDTAVGEVAECGYGAFKLSERFVDEEDPENEQQEIFWEPIYNAYDTVIWDSNAKRPDKMDAEWCVVLTGYTNDAFDKKFPDLTPASAYQPRQRAFSDWEMPDIIYIAERYEVVKKKTTFHVYRHVENQLVESYPDSEMDKIRDELVEDGWEFVRERKVDLRTIEKSVFTGMEFVEEAKAITGKYIPVIPMYGFRKFIDGKEYYRGLVRKLKDSNRLFNATISKMAEAAASSPDSKPIFFEDQIKGLEDHWADTSKSAYALVRKTLDAAGNPLPIGPLAYTQPTQIDPNTLAASETVKQHVQGITGNAPQDTVDPDASGKAINALRARENLNTQVMTDNIIQSIAYSGLVYESKAEALYVGEMTKRTLAEDGATSVVRINTSVFDAETGTLVPAKSPAKGKYKVDVEVGPQYESQREATIETLEKVMEMVGQESRYFPPLLAMWMKNISGTGLQELKEFNRMEMLKLQLIEPETEEEAQMLQELQQQTDPQEELNNAISTQQKAEAINLVASAKNKDADTMKKKAETAEILAEIGQDPNKVTRLKYNPQSGALEGASNSRAS